ncbi:MAG: hypothetical protein O3A46_14390 [Candidatus Poribacteria bacterium]|nr:hypothetical protein [Candidatus Poribacteria bacterium]
MSRRTLKASRLTVFGLVASLVGAVALAPAANAKDNGGAWLLEPVGARATALRAFSPLADDASAVTLNPAGIAAFKRTQVLLYTREGSLDAREHYLGTVWPIGTDGTLGVAWRNAGVGDSDDAPFTGTDDAGNITGSLGYKANSFELAYGHAINTTLSVGGALGLVTDSFSGVVEGSAYADDESSSGFRGLTVGVTGIASEVVNYGVVLRNVGGSLGTDGTIPVVFAAGAAVRYPKLKSAVVSVELERMFVDLEEATTNINIGTEYTLNPIALRVGTSQSADRNRWFAGFGVKLSALQVDYAYQFVNSAARRLADSPKHYVSLSYLY